MSSKSGSTGNISINKFKNVDPEKLQEEFKKFEDLEEKLENIKKWTNMSSKDALKPVDFYDDVVLELEDYGAFQTKFIEEMKKFQEFIEEIKKINKKGKMSTFSDIGLTGLAVATVIPNDTIDNSWYFPNESPSTGPVDLPPWDGGEQEIDPINPGGTTVVGGGNVSSEAHAIEEPTFPSDGTVAEISEVNGNSIVDKIYDENGNLVAVSTEEAGKKTWYKVVNGEAVMPDGTFAGTYSLPNDIDIIVDGKAVKIPAGTYSADQVMYNDDGSISGLRFATDKYKVWLSFDSSGNINNISYIRNQTGVFAINNPNYDIYDMYGNKLGKFPKGSSYIYDVLYNKDGTILAFRLSKDNEYENWLYMNGNTTDGSYSLVTKNQNNGTTSVSMFDKNKGLFGLLGILFVGLGATVVVRKKMKNKAEEPDEYDEEYSYDATGEDAQEETVPVGNYGVYDVKENEDGTITDVRITPNDSDDEYWVKV